MGRMPRINMENTLYYITCRGDHEQNIFVDNKDYGFYLDLLKESHGRNNFSLFAYCFLPNHFHLLLELGKDSSISSIMHGLNSTYTKYFNSRYHKKGHLFQERYKVVLIEKDAYLVNMTAYLHLNPLANAIVKEIGDYPYSSYGAYLYYGGDKENSDVVPVLRLEEEIKEVAGSLQGKKYRDFIIGVPPDILNELGREIAKKNVIGSEEFAAKVRSKMEDEKRRSEELLKAGPGRGLIGNKKFLIASGVAVTLLGFLSFYLYSRTVIFKDRIKTKDSEFSKKVTTAREAVKKDLEEKYRADMVSYEAMSKRLEIEKSKSAELEKIVKEEEGD